MDGRGKEHGADRPAIVTVLWGGWVTFFKGSRNGLLTSGSLPPSLLPPSFPADSQAG